MAISRGVLSLIGNTPMVRLNRIGRDLNAEVCVKLEYLNPSGSIKDRIALRMIEDAEKAGKLRPGMEILDASTGNTAASLAFVGAVKGYRVRIIVPKVAASEERLRIMKAYGATVDLVEGADPNDPQPEGGIHGDIAEKTPRQMCWEQEKAAPGKIWWARQFSSPGNDGAHCDGTGAEILAQTGGKVDAFVAAVGTGGTLVGVARALRAKNPAVKIIAVEPKESPVISNAKKNVMPNPELRGGLVPRIIDEKVADQVIPVSEPDAIAMAYRLAKEEGLYCGLSSGANVAAALQIAREMNRGQRVVTILVDSRDRYLFKEKFTT